MSKQRAKGTSFETNQVNWTNEFYPQFKARRNPLAGNKDKGDIDLDGIPLECKNTKAMTLGTWIKEAEIEAANANARACPVVHKRKGVTDGGEQYTTMKYREFCELLHYAKLGGY